MSKKKQTGPVRVSVPRKSVEPVGEGAPIKTRIDPPHQVATAEPAEPIATPTARPTAAEMPRAVPYAASFSADDAQPAPFVQPLAQTFEQMQNQAAQLAAQLCKQQATLDHREAEVNARAAAVESQVRTARIWLVEKLDELAQRKAELHSDAALPTAPIPAPPSDEHPGQTMAEEASIPSARPSESTGGEATPLSGTLRFWNQLHWQEEFERWRSAREAASETITPEHGAAASGRRAVEESLARASAASDAAERQRAAEQQLAQRTAELDAGRRELAAEREALDAEREVFIAERQADLQRLAEQRRVMSEKLWRQRARLRRRREAFDARELALRQLRAELLRTQQQTLEMRLGAEELWAHLRSKAPGSEIASPRSPASNSRREGAA